MPPKKAAAQEKKVLLGRPSNNLKIGIVGLFLYPFHSLVIHSSISQGLPNVGKSSFFNALSETGPWLTWFHPSLMPSRSWQIWGKLQTFHTRL
jgi:hypothetical protein